MVCHRKSTFLVNPVVDPLYFLPNNVKMDSSSYTRNVYLPKGTQWIDFWTGKRFDGGQNVKADATFETMPLFVRAGSIIPMGPFIQYSTEKSDPLEIRIYAGADGDFTLYEDETNMTKSANFDSKADDIILSWSSM
jgi:alpha-D-xyloside xylohydrolase